METVSVELENEHLVSSGDVSGAVRLHLVKYTAISGVVLSVKGDLVVKRSDSVKGHSDGHRCTLVDHTMVLWGSVDKKLPLEVLPDGRHSFPFDYQLPRKLPCSFEGTHGHVRYALHARVLTPSGADIVGEHLYFTLLPVNHNHKPSQPVEEERTLVLDHRPRGASLLCGVGGGRLGGRVNCTLKMPRCSVVCGDNVPVTVRIHNSSGYKVRPPTCSLIQSVRYEADDSLVACEERVVCEARSDVIIPGEGVTWSPLLSVPPLPPSHLATDSFVNRLIDVTYRLEVHFEVHTHRVVLPADVEIAPSKESDPLVSCLYREAVKPQNKKRMSRSYSFQGNQIQPSISENDVNFAPKYRVYRSLLDGDVLRELDNSPRCMRRQTTMKFSVDLSQLVSEV